MNTSSRNPSVACLMSVYSGDSPSYITESIESIFDQSYPCTLYLQIDGAVDHDIYETVKSLHEKYKFYLFLRNDNRGLAHSLNELLSKIEMEGSPYTYIARMDADDVNLQDRLSQQVDFLEKNNDVDVLGGGCIEFNDSTPGIETEKKMTQSHSDIVRSLIQRSPFVHPTVMFRSKSIQGVRYPTNTHLTEDYALWVNLAASGKIFANLPYPLIRYRLSDSTLRRRHGILKGYYEFSERLRAIRLLKQRTFFNYIYAFSFFLLRSSPIFLSKIIYSISRRRVS